MNLSIAMFGLSILDISISTDDAEAEAEVDGSGTTASTFGFTAEGGRWQPGADLGEVEDE